MTLSACTKTFLDKKPDQSLVVPHTLQDFQALLDNSEIMNVNMPSLQEVSSDDNYLTNASFASVTVPMYQNTYLWKQDIYAGYQDVLDWNLRYQSIFYSNVVLEGLAKLDAGQQATVQFKSEKGSALYYRAFALFQVAQLFCKPYNAATAATDMGVPVRIISDINIKSTRATVAQTYAQVITDLQNSLALLPQTVNIKTKPTLAAGNGLLARVYLSMRDYANALKYADAGLKLYSKLMDYNNINPSSSYPFAKYNDEVLFQSTMLSTSVSNVSRLHVDTTLYASYDANDLRLSLFFKPVLVGYSYRGSYSGSSSLFNGITTDEMYLTRAECYARQNNTQSALNDLNKLMATRWKTGTFTPFTASSANEALNTILTERRKELLLRGLRWSDLRRLNMEEGRAITLKRIVNSTLYTLPPNDLRYVLPIPSLIIQLTGMPQNPR